MTEDTELTDAELDFCIRALASRSNGERTVPARCNALRYDGGVRFYIDLVDPATLEPGQEYITWVIQRGSASAPARVSSFRSRVRPDGLGHDTLPPNGDSGDFEFRG